MLHAKLALLRVIAVLICMLLTGAAVLLPEHPWLQLLASASCGAFAWFFGVPPAALLAAMLARMRPERLAQVLSTAAQSMPPERAQLVMQSLRPPALRADDPGVSIPPVPIVFEDGATDGWEAPAPGALTPADRPPRKH